MEAYCQARGKKKKKKLETDWVVKQGESANGVPDEPGCSKDPDVVNDELMGNHGHEHHLENTQPPQHPMEPEDRGEHGEHDYSEERDRIKEELAEEFNHNMRRECENGEQLVALQKDIETLKEFRCEFNNTWEVRATQVQQQPQQQQQHQQMQQQNQQQQQQQQFNSGEGRAVEEYEDYDSYDGGCGNAQEGHIEVELHQPCMATKRQLLRKTALKERSDAEMDLIRKLQENFDRDSRILREQNNKCMEEIKTLTSEKFEQSRHIRELYDKIEHQNKSATEITVSMKQEFNTRVKSLLEDNEKMKKKQKNLESERNELRRKMETCCRSVKDSAQKLSMSQHTVTQCEDSLMAMRNENKNLSKEIVLLRQEKSELLQRMDAKLETERILSLDKAKLLSEIKDWTSKYTTKEKETLQNQKIVTKIRKEVDAHLSDFTQVNEKLAVFQSEASKLRQLYETERQENMRLHERFNQDAELIRQKEAENNSNRIMLNKIKNDFENLKRKMEEDNMRILRMEGEKQSLQKTIEKLKTCQDDQFKEEMYAVHGKYAKEFTKRFQTLKTKYSKEIEQLKQEIKILRQGAASSASVGKSQSCVTCGRCEFVGTNEHKAHVNSVAREIKHRLRAWRGTNSSPPTRLGVGEI